MKKHDLGRIIDARMGGFEKQKEALRIIIVAIQEVSLDHEIQ